MLNTVVFTYHAMERIEERFPEISQGAITVELQDQRNWLMSQMDQCYGRNKQDGLKMIITIEAKERKLEAVVIKKIERNKPTLVVLSIIPMI